MGEVFKVLGQAAPAATTQVDLYTVPAATTATISTIQVCNQNATKTTFRIRVRVNGAANDPKQFLFYEQALLANDAMTVTLGMTLGAGDVVSVYAGAANVSFNLFGVEVT
jgi:hypothetical protein